MDNGEGKATIISLGGLNFFAEVPILEEYLPDAQETKNAVVILRLRGNEHIGSTAVKWLERYNNDLREGGNLLMLAGVQSNLIEELDKVGLSDAIGRENIFEAQTGLGAAEDKAGGLSGSATPVGRCPGEPASAASPGPGRRRPCR